MKTPNEILKEFYLNFNDRVDEFKVTYRGEDFDMYKHKNNPALELAIISKHPKVHGHSKTALFCFLDDATLTLGALKPDDGFKVEDFNIEKGTIYPIAPYVLHAGGPGKLDKTVRLLIYNPDGERSRSGEYPDDTFIVN